MKHAEPHPRAGQVVPMLVDARFVEFEIEDWADRVRDDAPTDTVWGRIIADSHGPLQVPISKVFSDADLAVT